jgi:hypothetical protein
MPVRINVCCSPQATQIADGSRTTLSPGILSPDIFSSAMLSCADRFRRLGSGGRFPEAMRFL